MPAYLVTDSQTGRKLRLTGDSPPTDAELESIFANPAYAPKPAARAAQPDLTPRAPVPVLEDDTGRGQFSYRVPDAWRRAVAGEVTPREQRRTDLEAEQAQAGKVGVFSEANAMNWLSALGDWVVQPASRPIATLQKGVAGAAAATGILTPEEHERTTASIEQPPRFANIPKQEGVPAQLAAGAVNAGIDFANMVTDPDALMQLGVAGVPSALQKRLLVAFGASMAVHAPQQLMEANKAYQQGNYQEFARNSLGGAGGVFLSALVTRAGITKPGIVERPNGARPAISERAPAIEPPRPPMPEPPTTPVAEAPVKKVAPSTLPDYVQEAINRDYTMAQKLGLLENIVDAARRGLTSWQIAPSLKLPPEVDAVRLVRSVRAVEKIPAADEAPDPPAPAISERAPALEPPRPPMPEPPPTPTAEAPKARTESPAPSKAPATSSTKAETPLPSETRTTGQQWDSSKLGTRIRWLRSAGYVTKEGKLSRLGEALAERKWEVISEAGQKVIASRIQEDFQTGTESPAPTKAPATLAEYRGAIADVDASMAQADAIFADLGYRRPRGVTYPEAWEHLSKRALESSAENTRIRAAIAREMPQGQRPKVEAKPSKAPATLAKPSEAAKAKPDEAPPAPAAETPPAPRPPTPDTPPPEIIGMGGAVPGEFVPPSGTPTSIKNAAVDAERARRGLPPALQPARRSFGEVWDEAMAKLDRDPASQDALVAELKQQPRALTDLEDAMLLQRQVDLQNEYAKATRDLALAYADGRAADVADGKVRVQILSDKLLELYDIDKAAGTATGRGLAARRMLANEDFTLARMEIEKRVAKGGEPVTEAERARLADQSQRIADLERQLAEHNARMETERAQRAASDALQEMVRKAEANPEFPAHVRGIADRIVDRLEAEAVQARARLRAKFARTSAGVDPTILSDVAIIMSAKIARGVLDFSRAAAEAIGEFGDGIKPYLEQAWAAANKRIDKAAAEGSPPKDFKGVHARVRKTDTTGHRAQIKEGLKAAVGEARPPAELGRYIQALAENFVRSGISEREALIDAVHGELQSLGLDWSRRETMDAISGYGQFHPLDPDAIKAQLRDLRGQMQQVAKLEDIQTKQPLLKTGVERRTPSDAERRLIQQVNEAKRRFGVVPSDPARTLRSALDTIKTRLANQIADLNYQISTRQKIVKDKTQVPYDAEATALQTQRDLLRVQFDQIFPKAGITDAQRIAQAERALKQSIDLLEKRIAARETGPMRQPSRTPATPELEALRARREELRAEMQALREAVNPRRSPEEIALGQLKANMARQIAEYTERLATSNFAPKAKRTVRLDAEALRLKAASDIIKAQYRQELARDEYRRRSLPRRVFDNVKEALNLPRAVMASWDLSAVLRQGGAITFGHPKRALNALAPMFRALRSEQKAAEVMAGIEARPNAPRYAQAKLYIAPLHDVRLTANEEMLMSRLARRVPGVGASQRAFITFLNVLRADSFDAMTASLEGRGTSLNPAELQAIGNYINVATGRGNIGQAAGAAETLATVFFAPRLVASRFQMILGEPLYRGSARTRLLIASEYARSLAGVATFLGLGMVAGGTVQTDPRSSDFGKLRFGDTRIDPWAGLQQVTVLLSRLATGEKLTASGKVQPIRGEGVPYGGQRGSDVAWQFLRTKLAPVPGAALDVASGRNVVGEPVTATSAASGMLIPLSYRDIYDVMVEQGVPAGAAMEILSMFGMGVQQYQQLQGR